MHLKFPAVFGLLAGTCCLLWSLVACVAEPQESIAIRERQFAALEEARIAEALLMINWPNEGVLRLDPASGARSDAVYQYLRPMLREMVRQRSVTRRDSFEWDVHIVMDSSRHAYLLPGGQLVLHTGFLRSIDNEAECVGVLARAVAMAEQGAPMKAMRRMLNSDVALGKIADTGLPEPGATQALRRAKELNYLPGELSSADSLAAILICPTDYEELALAILCRRLAPEKPYNFMHRRSQDEWQAFMSKVLPCPGADSLYRQRYQQVMNRDLPR